jgi:hypothetical protein
MSKEIGMDNVKSLEEYRLRKTKDSIDKVLKKMETRVSNIGKMIKAIKKELRDENSN